MIDGLIIGLWVVTFLQLKYVPPAYSKALGIFWIMPMFGIVLVRLSYLSCSYFYGKSANQNPSLLFKIHRAWVTFAALVAFILFFMLYFMNILDFIDVSQ